MTHIYRIIVSPKGRKPSEHYVEAKNVEEAERQAAKLGAKAGTTNTRTSYYGKAS